ncbi:hypothetical protein CEXT_746891 [Caerostris extrusa]|uniref:Uncharacterized protein n=1 Tax=Caerostris extrusa TaxID=172846 RepID=A0AAV4TDT2_CAEEX|nr:hypothetical protein CEXT_746891 [Caerostris extrusa]
MNINFSLKIDILQIQRVNAMFEGEVLKHKSVILQDRRETSRDHSSRDNKKEPGEEDMNISWRRTRLHSLPEQLADLKY